MSSYDNSKNVRTLIYSHIFRVAAPVRCCDLWLAPLQVSRPLTTVSQRWAHTC